MADSGLADPLASQVEVVRGRFGEWQRCHSLHIAGQELPPECACFEELMRPLSASAVPEVVTCMQEAEDDDVVFNPLLPEPDRIARDDLICGCYLNPPRGVLAVDSAPLRSPSRSELAAIDRDVERAVRERQEESTREVRFRERYSTSITALNFARTREEAIAIGGVYLPQRRQFRENGEDDQGGRSPAERVSDILEGRGLTTENCLSYRDFLFNKQFPSNPEFYRDLNRPFREEDWNYKTLQESLRRFTSVDQIVDDPEGRQIYFRMKFLHSNPIFKNLFMSNDLGTRNTKPQLYEILKQSFPRPQCEDNRCLRGPDWGRQLTQFQSQINPFLSQSHVIDDIQTGMRNSLELSNQAVAANERRVIARRTAEMVLREEGALRDPQRWMTFCHSRNRPAPRSPVNPLLLTIEESFGTEFTRPERNEGFQRARENYCQNPRRTRDGTRSETFARFQSTNCSGVDIRTCLSRFTQEFPIGSDDEDGELNLTAILSEPPPTIGSGDTSRVFEIGSNSALRGQSISSLENGSLGGNLTQSQVSGNTVAPVRGPAGAQSAGGTQPQTSPAVADNFFVPTFPTGASPEVVAEVQEAGRRASRSRDESREIADEIASIRNSLQSETRNPGAGDEASQQRITDLNARLRSLEGQLRTSEENYARDLENYRNRLAASGATGGDDETDDSDSEDGSRRIRRLSGTTSGGSQVSRDQLIEGPVAPVNFQAQGGASLGGSGPVPGIVSASAANLQRYGVAEVAVQRGIVVADPSGSVNVQQLRSDAGSNVIEIPTSVAEFNSLPEEAKQRYFDQARGLSGSVVKLTFSDGEAFLVKQGQDLTLVPSVEGSPLRAPASERRYLLSEIRAELGIAN